MAGERTPPAWHDDPEDSSQLRWWDGTKWTEHRHPKASTGQRLPPPRIPVAGSRPIPEFRPRAPKQDRRVGWIVGGIVVAVLAVGAIANGFGDDDGNPGRSPSGGVPWEDYDDSVKQRIDRMAGVADCRGLQDEFDTADANNDITMNRTGHNNAALMGYIDNQMRDAGCYD